MDPLMCKDVALMYVGFGVLTAVVMKSSISWNMTPYILLKVNLFFEGTCLFHFQGVKNKPTSNVGIG
jgi:hypothetical protein